MSAASDATSIVPPGDVRTGIETDQKRRQRTMYILTFVFGIATLLALSLAAVQIIRSIQLDKVLLKQSERLEAINRYLIGQSGYVPNGGDPDNQGAT